MGRPRVPRSVVVRFWELWLSGLLMDEAAAAVGVSRSAGLKWIRQAGGVPPERVLDVDVSYRRLSVQEREEIAIWHAQGVGVREIALNRPGIDGGSDSTKDEGYASTTEVSAGVAGASGPACGGGA